MKAQSLNSTLNLIPEPHGMKLTGGLFSATALQVIIPSGASEEDTFAADYMKIWLNDEYGVKATVAKAPEKNIPAVTIARNKGLEPEGYELTVGKDEINIKAADAPGVYYATQTLRQLFMKQDDSVTTPCLQITDYPALKQRSIHYDTKHHQGTEQYVIDFIKELAHYKVNTLVWEWEDKLAYESHPEVGAPGAFTIKEMQNLTVIARQHHVEIVPLVQGLGHVSYILKHPQYRHVREIPDSNWEFCPLKEESYELLFSLFDDAIEATPTSTYFHIGCDETYELGLGVECGCADKLKEIGKAGLMNIFLKRCTEHVESKGRKVIAWSGGYNPNSEHQPPKSMVGIVGSNSYQLNEAYKVGYHENWVYAPNPGIVPLHLPLFPWVQRSPWPENGHVREVSGTFRQTGNTIGEAARTGIPTGSITTSWDDSGLHNQCWMPRFICAAEFSWNPAERDMDDWAEIYFNRYFGTESNNLAELFKLLMESSQFYYQTLQRGVWHWYNLGKVHLPDLPRGDLEYNNYWRVRYRDLTTQALVELQNIERATTIIEKNLAADTKHKYDLEICRVNADLLKHNARLFIMLAELEETISNASDRQHFADRHKAHEYLLEAQQLISDHLANRERVYNAIVELFEQTRLPKGLSLPDKPFVHIRDRARHLAFRTADMKFLIIDEELLDMEGYLEKLTAYTKEYKAEFCSGK